MSKASKWAKRRLDALLEFRGINDQRPTKCPEVYFRDAGWMHYEVDDLGEPVIIWPQLKADLGADNLACLLAQARWILDTFGEA